MEKLRQVRAARLLEKKWTKEEILEAYLNLAPFRGEIRGISAASSVWFRKIPLRLSAEESAILVAMLRGPNAPIDRIERRACDLLPDRCEVIRQIAGRAATQPKVSDEPRLASHLAVRLQGEGRRGRFVSTIDADLQRYLTDRLASRLSSLKDQNVRDGAALVIENSTGRVLAYVGSAGKNSKSPQVDGIRARRQAGSTLKPFLYARAIERRLIEPDSWIEDSAIDLVFPLGIYRPRNHDRHFHGWVRARTALGSSLNVPAVKLLRLLGEEDFWRVLSKLGFQNLAPAEEYGPALALGVADLTLWDLTNAYRTLANDGVRSDPVFAKTMTAMNRARVFSMHASAQIEEILSSKDDRELGFGFDSVLSLPFRAAVKTGTSKDMRDNWCLGWSRDYTIGIWVGNFDGEPMWDVSGTTGAAPVFTETLIWLHENRRSQSLERKLASERNPKQDLFFAPTSFPHPRILYPPSGLVLALDPEIPSSRQKLPLQAETAGKPNLSWRIGESEKMPASDSALWPMRKGRHVIRLMDRQKVLEEVEIQVR
jgi:penicillin-binding protein 1C